MAFSELWVSSANCLTSVPLFYAEVLHEIQENTKPFQQLFLKSEHLKNTATLEQVNSWNLGILNFRNFESVKLCNFETLNFAT